MEILRCPRTGQPLRWVDAQNPRTGLTTLDGKYVYPVRNGIPILLAQEAKPS